MNIKEWRYEVLKNRIYLTLVNEENLQNISEISPLKGFSKESLEDVLDQLHTIQNVFLSNSWTLQNLSELQHFNLFPSVYFGLESALLDLIDPIKQTPQTKMYALLMGNFDEILAKAHDSQRLGFKQAKLKLSNFSFDEAIKLVTKLENTFQLRLDFNRKWEMEKTLRLCNEFPYDFFAYIEEPAKRPEELVHFYYPFALDETLRENRDLAPFLKSPHLKALILKPTLLYPISSYLDLGPKPILTSSFESKMGLDQIRRLIYRFGLDSELHGLDTLRYVQ